MLRIPFTEIQDLVGMKRRSESKDIPIFENVAKCEHPCHSYTNEYGFWFYGRVTPGRVASAIHISDLVDPVWNNGDKFSLPSQVNFPVGSISSQRKPTVVGPINYTNIGIMAWIDNHIHLKQCDAISNQSPDFTGGLVKPPLKLRDEWLTTSHIKQ